MSKQNLKHSYRHFADLQLSSNEFYRRVEKAVRDFKYPDIIIDRRSLSTGWLAEKREYLCIGRGEYRFYVCAAPYGRSYFISWWFWHERDPLYDWLFRYALIRWLFESTERKMYNQDTRVMFENAIDAIVSELSATAAPEHVARVAPSVLHN